MKTDKQHRGFTLIELLVVMSIIALLLSILMPALGRARHEAMLIKDATQIKGIHSGWLIWASGHDGRFPTPGYVNRKEHSALGQVKGRGPEDRVKNTTTNIHSLAVMENLYTPDRLMSGSEPNGNVFVLEAYDYSARNVKEDVYWHGDLSDEGETEDGVGFQVDLSNEGDGCNISYASIPLIGARKTKEWCSSGSSEFAVMSNRGPDMLTFQGELPKHSITYDIFGGGRTWVGNVCWQDNHMTYEETIFPAMSIYRADDGHVPDSLFNINCVSGLCHFWGGDTWLTLVSELSEGGDTHPYQLNPTMQWDE